MAFYDWNHNGKKDVQDDFIEYNIYKKSTENNNNNYSSNSGCSGTTIIIIAIILVILFIIGKVSEGNGTCMEIGCLEERSSKNTLYCSEHYMKHINDKYK